MSSAQEPSELLALISDQYAAANDSDILVISKAMTAGLDSVAIKKVCSRRTRESVLVLISTLGGDPGVAFRIARQLQQSYAKITVMPVGLCKSAGTLFVTAAHELVMDEHSELGPLDIQVLKEDGVGERTSGLTPGQALNSLDTRARLAFRAHFIELKTAAGMTTKTAADIASCLTSHLYGGIYAQIDPMRIGELERAQLIGTKYAERLSRVGGNIDTQGILTLAHGYPDHGFVIDAIESGELFHDLREPTELERRLVFAINLAIGRPLGQTAYCDFTNTELDANDANNVERTEQDQEQPDGCNPRDSSDGSDESNGPGGASGTGERTTGSTN